MENSLDRLWQHYQNTQFLLTQTLSHGVSFAIITAHNPLGSILTSCQNRLLDRQLQREIHILQSPYRAMVGASADFSHVEKSWAVFIDKDAAVALGRRFHQLAIYYVEDGMVSLVPCHADKAEIEIGAFSHRLNLVNELPDLDM